MASNRDDALAFGGIIAVVVGTIALAALLPARPAPIAPRAPAVADQDPSCTEWTDGCVTCVRTPEGRACSTPGIACVREALVCSRHQGG